MMENKDEIFERVRAMLAQALAEARGRGAKRITALHLVMYDHSLEALRLVRAALDQFSAGTLAEGAALVPLPAPSNFICWNCCGLRYQSDQIDGTCPNCGSVGLIVPPEIIFSLDHIEVAEDDQQAPLAPRSGDGKV